MNPESRHTDETSRLTPAVRPDSDHTSRLTPAVRPDSDHTSRLTPAVRRFDRAWFLTWRTYGTWLPGDERGFVDPVVDDTGKRVIHNTPNTPLDSNNPALHRYSAGIMRGEPVYLTCEQAQVVCDQLK